MEDDSRHVEYEPLIYGNRCPACGCTAKLADGACVGCEALKVSMAKTAARRRGDRSNATRAGTDRQGGTAGQLADRGGARAIASKRA
jgi:hypothetical protein